MSRRPFDRVESPDSMPKRPFDGSFGHRFQSATAFGWLATPSISMTKQPFDGPFGHRFRSPPAFGWLVRPSISMPKQPFDGSFGHRFRSMTAFGWFVRPSISMPRKPFDASRGHRIRSAAAFGWLSRLGFPSREGHRMALAATGFDRRRLSDGARGLDFDAAKASRWLARHRPRSAASLSMASATPASMPRRR